MKKILISLIVSLMALTSFAQADSLHLSFKGVPIDGTYRSFTSKLKQKGFTQDPTEPRFLLGNFAGYADCKIVTSYDENKDLVYGVGVVFQETNSWQILYSNYSNLKTMLTTKYGEPYQESEEFQHPYSADDDNSKIYEVKMGRSNYKTVFANKKGQIVLQITQVENLICYVSLIYVDNVNTMAIHGDAIDDL